MLSSSKIISFTNRWSELYFPEHIQDRLPQQICYPFVIYKSLRKNYNKRTTTHNSKTHSNQNTGFYISKTRTNMEWFNKCKSRHAVKKRENPFHLLQWRSLSDILLVYKNFNKNFYKKFKNFFIKISVMFSIV